MLRIVLFIALALPFFVFAQAPIPSIIYGDDEIEIYQQVTRRDLRIPSIINEGDIHGISQSVTREDLRMEITNIKRKLSSFLKKDKKERALLTVLLARARSDHMRARSNNIQKEIDDLETKIADLEVRKPIERVLLENTLENRGYILARLDDRQFFKLQDIPSLLKENKRLSISLDNAITSLQYRLKYLRCDESEEKIEEKQKESAFDIHKMCVDIEQYIQQLEEWKSNINEQRAYLLSDRNRYRHALEITAIKKAIQTTSASLQFLNNILSSRRDTLFAELKNELNKLNRHPEDKDFDILGNAQNALNNPSYDTKNKDTIRNLLKQEQQLRNSPIHLLFWEVNEKIYQLYGKLLKVDPDSAFDLGPYLLKILYIPPSVVLYTTN